MRVVLVSEFDSRGSGYTTLAAGVVKELERRRHEVLFLAFDYAGGEHPFKAAVVPTDPRLIAQQVNAAKIAFAPDVWVVCFDLTLHDSLAWIQRQGAYVGIFPVESDPLCHPSPWTTVIDTMDAALCESRFGTKLLTDAGLRVTYFPVGIDLDHWHPPSTEEREGARKQWGVADNFCVLTVCDNHERKNLPAMMAAFALASGREIEWPADSGQIRKLDNTVDNAYFIINTKKRPTHVGYDVPRLAETFGIEHDTLILQHEQRGGLDPESLRSLYWAADAFLLLSKAEGLGLPVLEAMACGVPVVAGDWTGTGESIGGQGAARIAERGYAVPPEYTHCDPFGNQYRRHADVRAAASMLTEIHTRRCWPQPIEKITAAALAYVREFTWERAGDVLDKAMIEAVERRKA